MLFHPGSLPNDKTGATPDNDLLVSPRHRMPISNAGGGAKMVVQPMIRLARLSPPHAVLCANGVGSSGFNPGPQILRQVPVFQRLQAQGHLAALLHNTDTDSGDVPTARPASPCRRA